ncbi:hypothetical protein KVY11_07510 [Acinetobacter sp. CWB-G5]|uniref:hypothetical protein n=1 Tax=Acinetobacter sp. CWB-G5 TaxID=2855444 RepID=UPI001C494AE4|nr:hypothetical protein [Acinetobacter sp. CWB-G5]MBV7308527.1 hypothetical protein [Acinetobacter sp. CWB-G5]
MKNVKMKNDMTSRQLNSVMSKFKVATISAAVTSLICASIPNTYASDIEIYKVPEDSVGSTTLMMMLDTSGSMTGKDGGSTSRMERLQRGLTDVLQGTATIPRVEDKIVMGLADFSGNTGRVLLPAKPLGEKTGATITQKLDKQLWYRIESSDGRKYAACNTWYDDLSCKQWGAETSQNILGSRDGYYSCSFGSSCRLYYQTTSVTREATHRDEMISKVNSLRADGGTPTPYAYAEAAAYLMGQPTSRNDRQVYFVSNASGYRGYYKICEQWSGTNCLKWTPSGHSWYTNYLNLTNLSQGSYSGSDFSLSGYYYIGRDPNIENYTGFFSSVSESKKGNTYIAPASITDQINNPTKKECSGQGIYFLTDGRPEPGGTAPGADGQSGTAYNLMSNTLGNKASLFSCANSPLGRRSPYANSQNAWTCIGRYTQALLDSTKNPTGLKIQTAVVGFGNDFGAGATGSNDVEDAKDWGTLGEGGWVAGSNSQDVVDSINAFITQLNKDIPSMSTGSSTIPQDALNPAVVQPYAYFPQFEPKVKPEDKQQIWFGNLKKYYVLNNGVYSSKTVADDSTVVVKQSKLQDLNDIWNNPNISYPEGAAIFKKGGALSHLSLGTITTDGKTETGRKLLTDYAYKDTQVKKDLNLVQIKHTYTVDKETKSDTTYARALMGLLGYVISNDTDTEDLDLSNQTASLRQMGSVYHSTPLLLTQSGKAEATKVEGKVVINTSNRDDYVLFGSTQGLLQVVDADTGVEKFAFVPKEIIENQAETFKQGGGNLAAGKDALYYGIDGEWAAHTAYVSKSDGSLTVGSADRGILGSVNNETETLTGKQWVYGGMRMGGRSYYALDLTDIDKPKVKFHIDPSTGTVYSQDKPNGTKYAALEKMGQSWSKPSIGYVNWKGQRKLVMIVGGGYDAGGDDGDGLKANGIRTGYGGYEIYNYDQKNGIGAGVYMFDADTGDLLWNTNSTSNASLKYSVVSQIRTIDRNNDGFIDHLYFGDLAGQAFRVDFKNDGDKDSFISQTTKILDLHQSSVSTNKDKIGTSPRFYTLPVFTAHRSAGSTTMFGGNTVVVTFVSGNQSSPLLATSDSPQKKDPTDLQFDGVFAIFDYDVYPSTKEGRYPTSAIAARSLGSVPVNDTAMDKTKLRYINGATTATAINKDTGWGGWYYQFDTKIDGSTKKGASVIKGLTTPIAMDGSLYVTQFDASDNGTTSSCGAGVKGHSFSQRFCLPSGVCQGGAKYIYNLGSGIVTLNVSSADGDPNARSLVVPDPNDTCPAGQTCVPNGKPKFLTAGGPLHFIPNRWYEKYSQ